MAAETSNALRSRYAIVLHGGAGGDPKKLPEDERTQIQAAMQQALSTGRALLACGGSALDAVERTIRILEDEPLLNAGRGAVFNSAGGHELDAAIMDGRTLACGAVAGVRTVKNPISLARAVMTGTRHVLLVGEGAEALARTLEFERVEPSYFSTDRQREKWERAKRLAADAARTGQPVAAWDDEHKGTVGCVALDRHGNLAAGTSTGGTNNKLPGRVSDTALIGAGTYADNATCGVSCTGTGEEFIRHGVAKDISTRMAYLRQPLDEAVTHVIEQTLRPNDGGVIAVSHDGTIAVRFNTPGMTWAAADEQARFEVGLGHE